jgi:hypothetical protein
MPSVSDHTTERGLWVQGSNWLNRRYVTKFLVGEA